MLLSELSRDRFKVLYYELKKAKTPKNAQSEVLEELIDSMQDLDAYYAGIALSTSEGAKIATTSLYDIDHLCEILEHIAQTENEDSALLLECRIFLKILKQINDLIKNPNKNG